MDHCPEQFSSKKKIWKSQKMNFFENLFFKDKQWSMVRGRYCGQKRTEYIEIESYLHSLLLLWKVEICQLNFKLNKIEKNERKKEKIKKIECDLHYVRSNLLCNLQYEAPCTDLIIKSSWNLGKNRWCSLPASRLASSQAATSSKSSTVP